MKRLFILATAAIVALASCAKTEVVYTDAPDQIAFKQVTNVMTKATTLNSGSLGVFANQTSTVYFRNTEFAWDTDGFKAAKTWPYEGTLDFTVYYPHNADASYADNVLTIPNLNAADALYYGEQRYVGTEYAASVPVVLSHICAKIEITDGITGDLYELKSVVLNNATTGGTVTVTYTQDPASATVATKSSDPDPTITATTECLNNDAVYVLPGAQTTFTVKFAQKAGGAEYTKTIPLVDSWVANKKYVYTLGVTAAKDITFTATVNDYETVTASPTVE